MGYSLWSLKNLIDRNRLKKFMQIRIDVSYACASILVGVVRLWFRRYHYPQKWRKFPFQTMGYSPWSSKNSIDRNWLKKFMQVRIDVVMHVHQFWWA